MIIIRFPTIMDGPVVRWYRTMLDAELSREVISASRNRVTAHGEVTPDLFNQAWEVHQRLKSDSQASTLDVVTHRKSFTGAISPVAESAEAS
jgi:hypothetical protein